MSVTSQGNWQGGACRETNGPARCGSRTRLKPRHHRSATRRGRGHHGGRGRFRGCPCPVSSATEDHQAPALSPWPPHAFDGTAVWLSQLQALHAFGMANTISFMHAQPHSPFWAGYEILQYLSLHSASTLAERPTLILPCLHLPVCTSIKVRCTAGVICAKPHACDAAYKGLSNTAGWQRPSHCNVCRHARRYLDLVSLSSCTNSGNGRVAISRGLSVVTRGVQLTIWSFRH